MFAVPGGVTWTEATVWLIAILGAGFLVSWLATDVLHVRRGPYILLLTAVTVSLTGSYFIWADLDLVEILQHHLWWGVLGGLIVAIPVGRGITMLPATVPEARRRSAWLLTWEGVVYGICEGVLLSALPAMVVWHAAQTSGWTDPWFSALASGALAMLASAAMITVHHLGYSDFRGRQLVPTVFGCSLLTLSFLLTGSLLAPVIGHVLMHVSGLRHGVELPPHESAAVTPDEHVRAA
jgi:hypothetical protein